jgi:predicted transcriptional regulator
MLNLPPTLLLDETGTVRSVNNGPLSDGDVESLVSHMTEYAGTPSVGDP